MAQSIADLASVLQNVSKVTWNETSLSGPGAVYAAETPKMLWRGLGNNQINIADLPNGSHKQTSGERSIDGISAVVFQNKIFIAWTGTDERINVMKLDEPKSKITLSETSQFGPALAVLENTLYLAWTGTDTRLNIIRSKNGSQFEDKVTLDERSHHSPALAHFQEKLFLAWTGTDTRLNVLAALSIGHGKVTLGETSIAGPALTEFAGQLYIGWSGTDTPHHLNWNKSADGFYFPPNSKKTSRESSNVAPALLTVPIEFFGPALLLYWTGTDNRLNWEKIEEIVVQQKK